MPRLIREDGKIPETERVKGEEYKDYLLKKLIEETGEFMENPVEEEYIDILEVLDAVNEIYDYSENNIIDLKLKKKNKKGGFKEGIVLKKIVY